MKWAAGIARAHSPDHVDIDAGGQEGRASVAIDTANVGGVTIWCEIVWNNATGD